ncbi:hypothetical protein ARMGADRAFT_1037952 [Armillaria gallica]|uniref:Uncharacterized protein n=1 Tax=Armillaria gallica TaxID=47427 RepID=A0A2H3CJX9_ARMGA|nr:hypothetical protein ARMGADRAFT_1037952 [Armillaria gallica]
MRAPNLGENGPIPVTIYICSADATGADIRAQPHPRMRIGPMRYPYIRRTDPDPSADASVLCLTKDREAKKYMFYEYVDSATTVEISTEYRAQCNGTLLRLLEICDHVHSKGKQTFVLSTGISPISVLIVLMPLPTRILSSNKISLVLSRLYPQCSAKVAKLIPTMEMNHLSEQ